MAGRLDDVVPGRSKYVAVYAVSFVVLSADSMVLQNHCCGPY